MEEAQWCCRRECVAILQSCYPLGILLAAALLVRILLMPLWAYLPNDFSDEGFWKDWMLAIHQHGLLNIFHTTTDYVGYHYVLWLLTLVYGIIGGGYGHYVFRLHLLVKVPPIFFDLALIVAAYTVSRSLFEELHARHANSLALGAAAIIAFQPAVLYDSAVWAQTDSAVTLAMLLSLFFVARGRTALGFGTWTAGFLIKPHPIIVLPLLLYLAWRQSAKSLASGIGASLAMGLLAVAPWLLHGDGGDIFRIYHRLFGTDYTQLSANAWNAWWFFDLTSHPLPAQSAFGFVTFRMLGLLFTASAGFLALLYLRERANLRGALVAAAYLAFAFYLLPVSTHDRYLYPFFALLLPLSNGREALAPPLWGSIDHVLPEPRGRCTADPRLLRPLDWLSVHARGSCPKLLALRAVYIGGGPRRHAIAARHASTPTAMG